MSLPDAPAKKQEEVTDLGETLAATVFQQHAEETAAKNEEKPKVASKKPEEELSLLEANFEEEVKPVAPKPQPSETVQQSQAALDDVQIVIPDGMQVRSHKDQQSKAKSEEPKAEEDPDAVI